MMSKWYALMTVDPGGTTGVMWGVFPSRGSMKGRVARGRMKGHAQFSMAEARKRFPNAASGELAAALWIAQEFIAFKERVGQRLHTELVVEDFYLRKLGSSKREGIAPARIGCAIEALLYERADGEPWDAPVYQQPSAAKGFATNERLKRWGLWVVGKEHTRDAARHLAKRLGDLSGA